METKQLNFKWDKDLSTDRYIISQCTEKSCRELVRIDNINIANIILEIQCGVENHFVVTYLKRKGNQWLNYRQEDYYGYANKKKAVLYRFPIPKLICAKRKGRDIYIEWKPSGNDLTYLVARRMPGTGWTRLGMTKQTYFIDKDIDEEDCNYIYTARCIDEKGK